MIGVDSKDDMVTKNVFCERLVEYAVEVSSWSYSYDYIAAPLSRSEVDEFIHLETLELQGDLTKSPRLAGRRAKIMIAPEKAGPRNGETSQYDRPVLGNLHTKKKLVEGYLLLPVSHVTRLTIIAASVGVTHVRVMATRAYQGKALVRSVYVTTDASGYSL
ncbi:hypothetical protein ACVWZK_001567 [Bradyrhizobium sp. GM0.4]